MKRKGRSNWLSKTKELWLLPSSHKCPKINHRSISECWKVSDKKYPGLNFQLRAIGGNWTWQSIMDALVFVKSYIGNWHPVILYMFIWTKAQIYLMNSFLTSMFHDYILTLKSHKISSGCPEMLIFNKCRFWLLLLQAVFG